MKPVLNVTSKETPRQILAKDFGLLEAELPISGGWGYSKEDACIIDKNDSTVNASLSFNGVAIEYIFVEKRIYEEMIIFRPAGKKYSGIKWKLRMQYLIRDADRTFDKLVFEVTAFNDNDWDELKAEFEGDQGYNSPSFDEQAHKIKRQEKMVLLTREFWFDITSFYGQELAVANRTTSKIKLFPALAIEFTKRLKKLLRIV